MYTKFLIFIPIICILFSASLSDNASAKEYIGIGIKSRIAVLTIDTNCNAQKARLISLLVTNIMPNGPAERAGLKINDYIRIINGKSLDDMTIQEIQNVALNILNEPENKLVILNILRLNKDKISYKEYKEIKVRKELINW